MWQGSQYNVVDSSSNVREEHMHRQTSNISRTNSQNLHVDRLV